MNIKNIISIILFFLLSSILFGQIKDSNILELQSNLESIVKPISSSGITISTKVIHADYDKLLYEYQPDIKVIPASITKLIISCTAFSKFGSGYQFKTIVYTDDNNINDGEINGNLYLKGFGDPDLNSNDITNLAEQINKSNIKKITGNIVADESYFDKNYYCLSGVYSGDTGPSYWPYITALSFNKNQGSSNPSVSAVDYLSSSLVSLGVQVEGSTISGMTPKASKEIAQVAHTIYDVMANMNKESDNHSAITIFKLLGANLKNVTGSLESGQEAVSEFLSELGINRYSYEILEGSGLTRYNRVNGDMYIKLLKYMYDDKMLFDYFFNSLSIAGKEGTLRNRMIGTEAEGNVYAKTGTLNSVTALSGYVIDRDNEILIFYIVMNGFGGNNSSMRAAQDDICVTLSQFSRK